jgi:molybdopterin-guanine dinucleotide biosynthesis protein A
VSLAPALEASVKTGTRKVQAWVAEHGAEQIFFPAIDVGDRKIDPFFNINRPEDLAQAEALLNAAAT